MHPTLPRRRLEKVEVNMTPMIDVVFQLMIFFMLTFNIIAPEGDFDVRMPLGKSSSEPLDDLQLPPIQVRLASGDDGSLSGISMNGEAVTDFRDLRQRVASFVDVAIESGASRDDVELEIDCDYELDYINIIDAITAVSGRIEGGQLIEMIKKISFVPLKQTS